MITPSPGTRCHKPSAIATRRRSTAASGGGIFVATIRSLRVPGASALARLVSWVLLVDDVSSPLAADDAAVLVAFFKRLQRIDDLHVRCPSKDPQCTELAREVNAGYRRTFAGFCQPLSLPRSWTGGRVRIGASGVGYGRGVVVGAGVGVSPGAGLCPGAVVGACVGAGP